MTTREATCAERITEQLAHEAEAMQAIYEAVDSDNDLDREQGYESLFSYALGIDTRQETIITLSWGGPASYLEVTHRGAEVYTVTYRFSDWFDTATAEVAEDSPLYRYACEIIELQEVK
jgi:hypothetical protein